MANFGSIRASPRSICTFALICGLVEVIAVSSFVRRTEGYNLSRTASKHSVSGSPLFLQGRPSGESRWRSRGRLEDVLYGRRNRGEPARNAGNEQLFSKEDDVLRDLIERGASPGSIQKIQDLKALEGSLETLFKMRQDAHKKCQAGMQDMCESPEAPLAEKLGFHLPKIREVQPFTLTSETFSVERGASNVSKDINYSKSPRKTVRARMFGVSGGRQGGVLSLSTDFEPRKGFLQLASGDVFDVALHVFFGGARDGDPRNFEGGNQGSFFNFMYPANTDYPWACGCDDEVWAEWKRNETQKVPCKNAVDTSMQNLNSYCDPLLHTINHSITLRPFSPVILTGCVTVIGAMIMYA